MPDDPIKQRFFKADIVAGLLAFDPFVTQNLLPLRKEFLVEEGFFDEVGHFGSRGAHARGETSTTDTAASRPHPRRVAIKCAAIR